MQAVMMENHQARRRPCALREAFGIGKLGCGAAQLDLIGPGGD